MLLRNLFEDIGPVADAAFAFGRFNPAHQGHIEVYKAVQSAGRKWYIGTNPSTQGPNDPLSFEQKSAWMQAIYPAIQGHLLPQQSVVTLASKLYELLPEGSTIAYVTDSKDWEWAGKLLNDYNGKEGPHGYYKFKAIKHVESPRVSSATALRTAARANDEAAFYAASGTDPKLTVGGKTYFETVVDAVGAHPEKVKKVAKKKEPAVAEVSKSTLDRYVTKAVDDHGHADFAARQSKNDPSKRSYHVDQKKTAEKRRQGISRALDRMSKEGVAESHQSAKTIEQIKFWYKDAADAVEMAKAAEALNVNGMYDEAIKKYKHQAQISLSKANSLKQGVAEGSLNEFASGGSGGNGPFDYGSAIVQIGQDYAESFNDDGDGADAARIVRVGKTFMSKGMSSGIEAFYAMDSFVRDHVAEELSDQGFNVKQDIYAPYEQQMAKAKVDTDKYRSSPEYAASRADDLKISAIPEKPINSWSKPGEPAASVSMDNASKRDVKAEFEKFKQDVAQRNSLKGVPLKFVVTVGGKPVDIDKLSEQGVAEGGSNAMADTAKRLSNKDDGKVAKLRAAGDKRREDQLKGRNIAKRNESVDLKTSLQELSNDMLGKYKKAASADATKADKEGNVKRGDKRFSGIVKATNKQFANDAKKTK
jgi:hypothetical protein